MDYRAAIPVVAAILGVLFEGTVMAERFGKGYENVDDAAAAALRFIERQPQADQIEYLGLIYQDPSDGKFYRTGLRTSGQKGSVRGASFNDVPKEWLRGMVHNHPVPGRDSRFLNNEFSDTDAETATRLGIPTYVTGMQKQGLSQDRVLPLEGRAPRKQVPGSDLSGNRRYSVPGQEFLAQIPIEEQLEAMARTSPMMRAYLAAKQRGTAPNPLTAALGK
jgi:hypothetical protein